ncbi:MAG: PEP/pyruvate-binding domain-containing protein [Candidatus Limnocylindria bacterium]
MTVAFSVPLTSLRAGDGARAGGKGANLGELVAAGFPVPHGFVVTTLAYERAARDAGVDPSEPATAGDRLRAARVPDDVAAAVRAAYRALGAGPVAVRSSATAEDLPGASFAGQQDTYLGIAGEAELLDAVRRCWASLWNERAVSYRRQAGIEDRGAALAVVVQRMVDAAAAGVLFTADPITGRRGRAVIDAAPGLGDALVSGAITPDHYVADPARGEVLERSVRGQRAVLDDARVRDLAMLGSRVEAHFGSPQDIEFAIDRAGRSWLVQSRPITTLYPLPTTFPDPATDLRAYFSFNVAQGYFSPLTPMGIQAFRLIASAAASAFGNAPRDPTAGPPFLAEAGGRLFLDVTTALRDPLGRTVLQRLTGVAEARSAAVFEILASDPRLALRRGSRLGTLRRVLPRVLRAGIPAQALRFVARPDRSRERALAELQEIARVELPPNASADARLEAFERLLSTAPTRIIPRIIGMVVAGQLSYLIARRLIGRRAHEDEIRTVVRAAPHNPTTEMDLALWSLATNVRGDTASRATLLERAPADLGSAYVAGVLPGPLQHELESFLAQYGARAVGEIDLGVPRWSEDPTHIIGALTNYLRLEDEQLAPDAAFRRGAQQAEDTIAALVSRVHGPRRALVRFFLRRARALVGLREVPKFTLVRLVLTRGRELLRPVGDELAACGRIADPADVYFLTLPETRRGLGGGDLRAVVAERRTTYARELARRHVPRVLLSDGTDAEVALVPPEPGALRGSPASPGKATGPARVLLSPVGARLEPGEILVAPSTDPGWTPLFLTAGGLVMEMGGMMSHGAVVAREYGIPAAVGVAGATERITTGQRVTVDGSSGVVTIVEKEGPPGS